MPTPDEDIIQSAIAFTFPELEMSFTRSDTPIPVRGAGGRPVGHTFVRRFRSPDALYNRGAVESFSDQ